jgi:hypothetical protein
MRANVRTGPRFTTPPSGTRRIYACGCWGVGNIGDEAILAGMRLAYPDLIAVSDRPVEGVHLTHSALEREFAEGDVLITGGGGVFHSEEDVRDFMLPRLRMVHERGGDNWLLGAGLDGPVSHKLLAEALRHFTRIGLRSARSVALAASLGFAVFFHPGFARIAVCSAMPQRCNTGRVLVIPRLTSAGGDKDCASILGGLRDEEVPVSVLLHSPYHPFNAACSEALLWQERLAALFPDTPVVCPTSWRDALAHYCQAMQVYTNRFHGAMFAQVLGIPWKPFGGGDKHREVNL